MAQRPRNLPQSLDTQLLASKLSNMKMEARDVQMADAQSPPPVARQTATCRPRSSSSLSGPSIRSSSSPASSQRRQRRGPRARRGRLSPSRSPDRRQRLRTPSVSRQAPPRSSSLAPETSADAHGAPAPLLTGPPRRSRHYIVRIRRGSMEEPLYASLTRMMAKDLTYGGTSFRKFDKGELLIRGYSIFFLRKALLRYVVDEDYTLIRLQSDPKNLVFVRTSRGASSPTPRASATSSTTAPPRAGPAASKCSVPPSQSKPTSSAGPKPIDPEVARAIAHSPWRSDAASCVSRSSGAGPSRLPARPPRPAGRPPIPRRSRTPPRPSARQAIRLAELLPQACSDSTPRGALEGSAPPEGRVVRTASSDGKVVFHFHF